MKIVIDNGKKSVIYKNKAQSISHFCEILTFEMQKIDKNISVHCRYDFEKDEDSIQIIREWKNKRNKPISKEEIEKSDKQLIEKYGKDILKKIKERQEYVQRSLKKKGGE